MAETTTGLDPVLSLDTLSERRHVKINGEPYELLSAAQLPLVAYNRIGRVAKQLAAIGPNGDGDLSDEQVAQVARALDDVVASVLVAPAETRAKLSDIQKLQIFDCFSPGAMTKSPAVAPVVTTGGPSTGASTSPGSSGSTGAARASGSRKSRKR